MGLTWTRHLGMWVAGWSLIFGAAMAQGPLVPPQGPIEPIGRSLDEIQPRIPIDHLPFMIESSGAYIVTKNLQADAGQNGIIIGPDAEHVDIDLGGFTLAGPGTGETVGLLLPAVQSAREAARRMSCSNGNIIGFNVGVRVEQSTSSMPQDYLIIKMKRVLVSSYQTGGAGAQFLMADGAVHMLDCSFVGNGGDGVQSSPKLQEAICDGVNFNKNGGNGWIELNSPTMPVFNSQGSNPKGGGIGAGKVSYREFTACTFNNNGLNGYSVPGGSSTGGSIPTESYSFNYEEVEFNNNGENGFYWESEPSQDVVPVDTISLNFGAIKFEYNEKNGLYIKDEAFPENPPETHVELNEVIAANNGANGILVGLLLPAVQAAQVGPGPKILAGPGGGPHVKVFDGATFYNMASGFVGSGIADLQVLNSNGTKNAYYAWELKKCRVTSFSFSGAHGNGLHGFFLDDIIIGILDEVQASGNGGDGAHISDTNQLICRKAGFASNNGHGIWDDTDIVHVTDCSLTSNTKTGATHFTLKGSKILQNFYSNNGEQGLLIMGGSSNTLVGNQAGRNGMAGIELVMSTNNSISECELLGNPVGLKINGMGNFVFKNIFSNPTDTMIQGGNELAPMETLSSSTNPWANIQRTPPPTAGAGN